jgi:hypothetical protein
MKRRGQGGQESEDRTSGVYGVETGVPKRRRRKREAQTRPAIARMEPQKIAAAGKGARNRARRGQWPQHIHGCWGCSLT